MFYMAKFYFEKEKEKILNLLEECNKLKEEDSEQLDYMVIKLQEISLDMKLMIDMIKENKKEISNYVKNEFTRRNKINELMPLFLYQYMNYNFNK